VLIQTILRLGNWQLECRLPSKTEEIDLSNTN
jgi:hypothetical protein